jgi:cation transport regulator ChaC
MEADSEHQGQSQNIIGESQITEPLRTEIFVAPGVPVVRSNTPKPLSLRGYPSERERSQMTQPQVQNTSSAPGFPLEAPAAPPLPEENDRIPTGNDTLVSSFAQPVGEVVSEGVRNNAVGAVESSPLSHSSGSNIFGKAASEFVWLFEYGLEMSTSVLNSANRLNGQALLYGPAVLKGYRIVFDAVDPRSRKVVANIRPDADPQATIWGVLYRIPRRLTERRSDQLSVLDSLYQATQFEPREVVVHEAYRKRNIKCITYIASAIARRQYQLLPKEQQVIDNGYLRHLIGSARQQKFPGEYLDELAQFSMTSPEHSMPQSNVILTSTKNDTPRTTNDRSAPGLAVDGQPNVGTAPGACPSLPLEQNTEPLPVLTGKASIVLPKGNAERESQQVASNRWLTAFALYVVLLFLMALALSVLQALGLGSNVLTASFDPLGAPWFVLVYGLLGGCVSSIITIGRRPANPPGFVVITWFTRPFIGTVLAALAYLALSSGFFVLTGPIEQHYALFSLVGALAGLCERWVFYRRV